MKHVETNASYDEIFNHLKSMGYKKSSGYDPNPNTFSTIKNYETMTTVSNPVSHPSGISAHIEQEHGGKVQVHFHDRNIKEAKSPEQKLRDFDKTRVGVGKPAIFDKKVVKYQRYKVPGEMVTHNIPVYSDGSTGAIPKGAQKVNEDDHNEMGIGTDSLVNKYKSMTPGQ